MNIAGIQKEIINFPYNKLTLEIYVSGCKSNCYNCHNPELQDFYHGSTFLNIRKDLQFYIKDMWEDDIAILGGDLLDQEHKDIAKFCEWLVNVGNYKELWLFTGKTLDEYKELVESIPELLIFDYIKTGNYQEGNKNNSKFASDNQHLYKYDYSSETYKEII